MYVYIRCVQNSASDWSKLAIDLKNDNDVTICKMTSLSSFLHIAVFLLSSLVSGLSFMSVPLLVRDKTIFFISDWPGIQKLEFAKSLETVRVTKFGINISNEMLLIATKYQGYSFYSFRVIKNESTGGGKNTPHLHLG